MQQLHLHSGCWLWCCKLANSCPLLILVILLLPPSVNTLIVNHDSRSFCMLDLRVEGISKMVQCDLWVAWKLPEQNVARGRFPLVDQTAFLVACLPVHGPPPNVLLFHLCCSLSFWLQFGHPNEGPSNACMLRPKRPDTTVTAELGLSSVHSHMSAPKFSSWRAVDNI